MLAVTKFGVFMTILGMGVAMLIGSFIAGITIIISEWMLGRPFNDKSIHDISGWAGFLAWAFGFALGVVMWMQVMIYFGLTREDVISFHTLGIME